MRVLVFLLIIVDCLLLTWGMVWPPGAGNGRLTPVAPLPLAIEQLTLLSELEPGTRAQLPEAVPGAAVWCLRASSLPDAVAANALAARALALGLTARPEAVDRPAESVDLLVYLPPFPSTEQASRTVRELAAFGIDAYVIPDGLQAGAVSLGVFTTREAAEARRSEIAQLGYPVRILEIARARRRWEVLLGSADSATLDAFLLGLQEDWPDLSGTRLPCPKFASPS